MGSRLEFRILGPLEVRLNGSVVRVGGPKQRALLALLLCHANRVVSRDRLIDELLADQPAGSAEPVLHVQVSRLRKALADGDPQPRLVARAPGYLLRVGEGELDLDAFDQRVADGRHALEEGDPGRAAVLLREAESLWRGRPLADLEFEPFARLEAERLEAHRLAAVEDRIEAELAVGRHGALCPELGQLVAEHPLRERLRGQLMLALYRSGRQAEALETYRTGRSLLAEELAVEPGPQLRQLQLAVLGQDTALDLPRPAAPHSAAALPTSPAESVPASPAGQAPASPAGQAPASPAGQAPASPADRAPAGPRSQPGPPARRRHTKWAALAAGAVAVLTALATVLLVSQAKAHVPPAGNLLALVAPGNGTVQATVPLRAAPTDVVAGSGSVWAAEPAAGLVARVDPARRAVIAAIPVGTHPSDITVVGGQVWVLDPADRTISRIDPRTNTVAQTIALGGQPSDVLASAGSLWVATHGGTVLRIDPVTGRTVSVAKTGGGPSDLAATGGAVWAATDGAGNIARIDARTGAVTGTIRVGDAPAAIAAGTAGLWVLDPLDATVARVDPRRAAVTATVPLGGAPAGVAQAGGYVWVADGQDGTLLRLDPRRGTVTRFRLGGHLSALAATGGGGLWAASGAAGASHRGGTLTSIPSYEVVDTIDPAASTSPNVAPPQLFGLLNDGLVTFNHAAGAAGARLVPDLALALPVPTGGGRSYTFRLRPGIRYSTGAAVRPSDVTHSFQRLFQLGSSGTSYFQAIAGAGACLEAPQSCDLSQGIVADDRAHTVTFHLIRPDPDFLYKLTLAYADVLPASVPGRQARAPLPATGPYVISRYLPGREVLLARNPRFREWSAAAQPAGNPDRIVIRLGVSGARGATAVAHGTGDFMPNLGQIPGDAGYFLHHRSQLRINPVMITGFMFLNVNAPPFNQLRVRRAVNLALDRRDIVSAYGGPLAAQPACQILPPPLPGYRRYCPYTDSPTADGRWHAPDLARARRLVAASGTAGMTVTVWNSPPPPQALIAETQAAVTALRQLGYHASQRLLPASTYFTYTNDSHNHAQVVDAGWNADYPSADAFIGKLTCSYFTPGNGQATTDASEFCDHGLDRQIARAATLQTIDPPDAAALWAGLDRRLTDLAIWLPTVNPNETDLISRRTGNYQYNPVWGALIDQLWIR